MFYHKTGDFYEQSFPKSHSPAPTKANEAIAQFVSTLKRFCNKEYGKNIWQRSYYDLVVRGERDYQDIWAYMDTNPARWVEDEFYCTENL